MTDPSSAVDLVRETLLAAVVIAAPILLVGMAAGLVIGLIQALTQIQDQTVSFVPKILSMAAVLVACLPWLLSRMVEFTTRVLGDAGALSGM
ncbi:MAG: flagellar biosynthetic protein FliQ [Planctomycetota bacterium]